MWKEAGRNVMPSTTRSSISREIAVEEYAGAGAIDGLQHPRAGGLIGIERGIQTVGNLLPAGVHLEPRVRTFAAARCWP